MSPSCVGACISVALVIGFIAGYMVGVDEDDFDIDDHDEGDSY